MAKILRKFSALPSPIPRRDNDDDSDSFHNDYSFAIEYKGPLIANLPRANPVQVDQIPTALPVSFSSLSSGGVFYPVVQPLVREATKKPPEKRKKDGLVDSAASPSVVLKPHLMVSGSSSSSSSLSKRVEVAGEVKSSVDSSSSSSSAEVREETDGDDFSNGEPATRVTFAEGSECDESFYNSDEESIAAAATPVAERKGKKGSCYRCLMGNRFTEKELCIVCCAKYCSNCVRRAMGAMPEGRKCQTCIGFGIAEGNRKSLGKCSRMLKRVLTDSELKQVMQAEISCKVNQLPSRLIAVNGKSLDEEELYMLQSCANPPKKLKPGDYWYDKVAGYWGKVGEKPCQIISPHMNIGGNIKKEASNGDSGIFINNREITKSELTMLKMVGVQCEGKPHFWVNSDGSYQEEGQNRIMGNIWSKARSLYKAPFTEDERERIKVIIQTNLYAYLAMVLEAHEEEMNTNQSSDQTGDESRAKTVSSISPRLKHFSDWLLKEKEEGNLKIFPASSRENAQTVAELWRVPAIQATYKRLRDTLPRNAVYFLGRILEISKAEYNPTEMDILQAEGISSIEGLSCVEFSFPPTAQEDSLEIDYQHDPEMKYQLIRLKPRSLGENWKLLDMFEDADLVIFCVSLTDYGEYIEDADGVLVNKMIANKQLFESMVNHPILADKRFLLVLTKFDLLEEKIEEVPLRTCEWFEDFNPLISQNQTSRHNPPMAQRAFHYIGYQFKRLYDSLVEPFSMRGGGRSFRPKLFVSQVSLESDTVDNALRYAREILKWHVEETSMFQEMSTTSIEASLSS
ncbi:PREDICTED: extra-large guanine nucleotide-binding protein 2 isoform X2 [Brassica oleracea var. oleracea]|uniref:extra-large guanine nucleotide-binding protein 2 isoform X2 n=1 Tax=Brassica oleracea var. oleracea TaxID=109376 RepID=UPI0006A753C6|nr:PREDICTED: extra-large guanine nucleotide-binding protein 2 isoform X2 [Brassica oleracea var. oleracea]